MLYSAGITFFRGSEIATVWIFKPFENKVGKVMRAGWCVNKQF